MIKSMTRSGIVTQIGYRSMLVGNEGFIPIIPSTYFPGEGSSTQINKMPYATETFSALSATMTFAAGYSSTTLSSNSHGYALISGATNKFRFATDTNAVSSSTVSTTTHTYIGGIVPGVSGTLITNPGTTFSNHLLNTLAFSSDTFTTSTALQSIIGSNVGLNPYTLSTEGPDMYFGGGSAAGTYYYGGIIEYFSTTNTASLVYTDANSRAASNLAGANNGSTAGYIAGGTTMPYVTIPTRIMKLSYSTNILSTISGTLTVGRNPVRTGIRNQVCAYYAGGKSLTSSGAVSATTVEKFSFATETSANLASASVNRDGLSSWNVS